MNLWIDIDGAPDHWKDKDRKPKPEPKPEPPKEDKPEDKSEDKEKK